LKRIPQLKLAAAHLILALISFFATAANAQTNTLSEAEIKGRELARQLCDGKPTESFKNTGTLNIRDGHGASTNFSLQCSVIVGNGVWKSIYQIARTNVLNNGEKGPVYEQLVVSHLENQDNSYLIGTYGGDLPAETAQHGSTPGIERKLLNSNLCKPFANSDFAFADLGLEFFHWPGQKILPKTTNLKRGRAYTLLESTNPHPGTNGYSRVVSWIDQETGGILEAQAFDAQGKLLKEFEPKSFKKVNGQWELEEMQIRNVQTGSRTRIEFDLKK
jgi:hypothetical protein